MGKAAGKNTRGPAPKTVSTGYMDHEEEDDEKIEEFKATARSALSDVEERYPCLHVSLLDEICAAWASYKVSLSRPSAYEYEANYLAKLLAHEERMALKMANRLREESYAKEKRDSPSPKNVRNFRGALIGLADGDSEMLESYDRRRTDAVHALEEFAFSLNAYSGKLKDYDGDAYRPAERWDRFVLRTVDALSRAGLDSAVGPYKPIIDIIYALEPGDPKDEVQDRDKRADRVTRVLKAARA
jgi:hypothetical protein